MSQKRTRGGTERPAAGSAERPVGIPELPPGGRANPPLLGLARVALGVATVIALYLTYASLSGGGVAGCGPEGGCGEVLSSRWSKWLGVPVSLPAAGLYLALLTLSLRLPPRSGGTPEGWCETALRIGAWSVLGAAVWFLGLSATVLGRFCPYCFAVHLAGSLGAVFLLKHLQTACAGKSPGGLGARSGWLAQAQWAALLLGVLIAGQLLYVPQTYRVTSTPAPVASQPAVSPAPVPKAPVPPPSSAPAVAAAPAPAPTAPASVAVATPAPSVAPAPTPNPAAAGGAMGLLSLHDARFRLDPATLPIMGKASAPYLMVSQFDYTCEHCRRTHGPIRQVQAYFSNELAVICLPMPLDGRCNEWVKRTSALHAQACQLAALSLGVWRAAPDKYHEFDDLLMTEPEALNIKVAFERAQKLVGAQALESAITDRWVPETLQLSVSLYRSNWLASRSGSMPMMNIGTNIVSGTVGSAGELFRLVDLGLGLKRRP